MLSKKDKLNVKLRIWHLLLFACIAALLLRVMFKRDSFPCATLSDATKVNSIFGELAFVVGDENGPYRLVSSYAELPVDRSAPTRSPQWINYQDDGTPKKFQICTDDDFSAIINVFENPEGNHLIVVFHTPHP